MTCILLCDHRSYQHIVTPTFRFWSWCSAFLEGSDTRSRSSNFGLIFSSSHFLSAEMKKCGNSDIVMQSTFRCWPSCKILWHYKGGLTFPSERKWKTGNSSEIWWKHPTKRRWSFERQSDKKFLEKGSTKDESDERINRVVLKKSKSRMEVSVKHRVELWKLNCLDLTLRIC